MTFYFAPPNRFQEKDVPKGTGFHGEGEANLYIDANSDLLDLHRFATRLGAPHRAFYDNPVLPCYTLTREQYCAAKEQGVLVVPGRELAEKCYRGDRALLPWALQVYDSLSAGVDDEILE